MRLASRPLITIAMRTHFTADTHFGHESIIAMSARPFSTVEEMDETMIANWNAVVAKGDNVWHVGDFAHRCDLKRKRSIFSRLNGSKHLVPGNHDDNDTLLLAWASIGQIRQIVVDSQRLVLRHEDVARIPPRRAAPVRPQPRHAARQRPVPRRRCRLLGLPSSDASGDP